MILENGLGIEDYEAETEASAGETEGSETKVLTAKARAKIVQWIDDQFQCYNSDNSEMVQELLDAYDAVERERAWIYNLTAVQNISEDEKEMVDGILDAERERHYAREDRLNAAKKLLREGIALVDTMEMNEAKLDEWIVKVKETLGEIK